MAVAAACFRAKLAGQPAPAGERTARVAGRVSADCLRSGPRAGAAVRALGLDRRARHLLPAAPARPGRRIRGGCPRARPASGSARGRPPARRPSGTAEAQRPACRGSNHASRRVPTEVVRVRGDHLGGNAGTIVVDPTALCHQLTPLRSVVPSSSSALPGAGCRGEALGPRLTASRPVARRESTGDVGCPGGGASAGRVGPAADFCG